MREVRCRALPGLPEVRPGDDLGALLAQAAPADLADGDVLCIAHKVVSKAEGRIVDLGGVVPGPRALELAASHGKDARQLEVVLGEAAAIVRERPGVLICRTRHGFVCANAGVDASNAGAEQRLVLLPTDPDASARAIRAVLRQRRGVAPAVVITDSFGRAWRRGQCEVAIGVAGLIDGGVLGRARRQRRARAARHGDRHRRRGGGRRRPGRAPRTRASPRSSCAGWRAMSRTTTGPAPATSCDAAEEDLFL